MDLEVVGRRKVEDKHTKKGKTSEATKFAYTLENKDGLSATVKSPTDIMSVGDSVFLEIDKKQTKLLVAIEEKAKAIMEKGDVSIKAGKKAKKK